MSSDTRCLLAGARAWLSNDGPLSILDSGATHSTMLRFSLAVHDLLKAEEANAGILRRASSLFDELASTSFPQDWFGERYEIAMNLAFIAWKHSLLLGDEEGFLEWLNVADSIATEELADLNRLEEFLYLPEYQKSVSLYATFLGSSLDLFLSVAILRRDRLRKPPQVIEAAIGIYEWLRTRSSNMTEEDAFFRTEATWLVTGALRMLGRMSETRKWLAIAKHERRTMQLGRAARLKLQVVSLLLNRERHQYRKLGMRLNLLIDRCLSLGLYREALSCRYALATTEKIQGKGEIAYALFDRLFAETESTIYGSIAGLSLGNIATRMAADGLHNQAEHAFEDAIDLIRATGDSVNLGSLIMEIADTQLGYGHRREAIQLFEMASDYYVRAGSGYWTAYAKIWSAQLLLDAGCLIEALKALSIAFPLVKRESMGPEGVHAMHLLNKIASRSDARKGPIVELIAAIRETD